MKRIYNFSAGPSMLPDYVLLRAKEELLNYRNTRQSVMEMSHRSKEFREILNDCEGLFREGLAVPDDYTVLFLQGGASTQFSMIPMNLMTKNKKADFILSGNWSEKAYLEASKYGEAKIVASSKEENYRKIPTVNASNLSDDADYLHFCYNNTIYGTRFNKLPIENCAPSVEECLSQDKRIKFNELNKPAAAPNFDERSSKFGDHQFTPIRNLDNANTSRKNPIFKNVPLVCDISSFIASEPLDISKFALLYACTQKNLGIAGLTVVICKSHFIGNEMTLTPTMLSYKTHAEKKSLYNTPPCYAIYICKLILEWLKHEIGGLEKMKEINFEKAKLIYDYIDNSKVFKSNVEKRDRSTMNIVFSSGNEALDEKFINFSSRRGLINIKGHRSVGGMRASIYNGMPLKGVEKLVQAMEEFERSVKGNV